jgi:iron complex transport system substrate-binding protein
MRIASLLPSATEIVYALGLGDWLVARSHACDEPEEAIDLPAVTARERHAPGGEPRAAGLLRDARVDLDLLAMLEPELVLTGGPGSGALAAAALREGLRARGVDPSVVGLDPRSIEGILNSITTVGAFAEAEDEAIGLVELLREQLGRLENHVLERRLEGIPSRRTVVLEWLDPPMAAGLWVPEMVRRAGGWELLGREGEEPEVTTWERVREVEPEVLVLALRGCDAASAVATLADVRLPDWFDELEAIREGECFAVEGDRLVLRPGPRAVEAISVLAELLDPEGFTGAGPDGAWVPLTPIRIGEDEEA